jgi:hypothetical protein
MELKNMKKPIIIIAVVIAVMVIFASGLLSKEIEVPWGEDDITGTIKLDIYAVRPDGTRFPVTGTMLSTVLYGGDMITHFSVDATIIATTDVGAFNTLRIDLTDTYLRWHLIFPPSTDDMKDVDYPGGAMQKYQTFPFGTLVPGQTMLTFTNMKSPALSDWAIQLNPDYTGSAQLGVLFYGSFTWYAENAQGVQVTPEYVFNFPYTPPSGAGFPITGATYFNIDAAADGTVTFDWELQ